MFIETDEKGYVTLAMEKFVNVDNEFLEQNVGGLTEVEFNDDISKIHDYKLVDGSLIYDYERVENREAEREAEKVKEQEREELLDSLPATLADSDDAICELYETTIAQQVAMDEQDAAICELYELMIGSGE